MKPISILITDEEAQQVKDLKYHCGINQKEIFKAGLAVLKDKIRVDIAHG